MSACSSGYPIHSNSSRALNSGSADLNIPTRKTLEVVQKIGTPTRHNIKHVTIVIRPMNAESFNPVREDRVHLDSVEDVEHSVPVVRVLAKIKVNRTEDATEGNVMMERGYEKPRVEEVSGDEARDLVPNFGGEALGGGDGRKV